MSDVLTEYEAIEAARARASDLGDAYLRKFGWSLTCNTPGAYWLWRRDFGPEDVERHRRWKERGPGPMGWPSEPKPFGVITGTRALAVEMTAKVLDPQPRTDDEG